LDFAAVALIIRAPNVLAVHPNVPASFIIPHSLIRIGTSLALAILNA
jgi:hypothetical protein